MKQSAVAERILPADLGQQAEQRYLNYAPERHYLTGAARRARRAETRATAAAVRHVPKPAPGRERPAA